MFCNMQQMFNTLSNFYHSLSLVACIGQHLLPYFVRCRKVYILHEKCAELFVSLVEVGSELVGHAGIDIIEVRYEVGHTLLVKFLQKLRHR